MNIRIQESPVGLPKMELKLPGETSFSLLRSDQEKRTNGNLSERARAELEAAERTKAAEAAERNKILCAPKAADDYEDRVKMIITKELAKEKVTMFFC